MTEQLRAPVFAPATGLSDLNHILGSVDLDELFSHEFLLPEGVIGPAGDESSKSGAQATTKGSVLRRTLDLLDPNRGEKQVAAPTSVADLCTPVIMPDLPRQHHNPKDLPTMEAVRNAAAMLGFGGKKRQRASAAATHGDGETLTGDAADRVERRLRNREHAKRSRLRKKFMLESLQNQLNDLREVNKRLRHVVKTKMAPVADKILDDCTEAQSTILTAEPGVNANPLKLEDNADNSKAIDTTVNIMEQDYRLIHSLQSSQQCFAISDPSLPDNPIVFASPGFTELTGYSMDQILGRNCRFLQGPGTDQRSVQMIRDAIEEQRDVSVCLLNYRQDGTPFWNQFFIAPLRACDGTVVNYVSVQCEVNSAKPEEMMQRVKRIRNIEMFGE
uniref:LOV domain-containing protein n=1 Tax=Phaeomonas parva TaxID=124430 RepID=A0A7S1XX04_9STRA|eukprot:CAMPEP_0118850904 /NCGR_PEP_ID=MMETSP1163-20130328/550_1 /TAXON_ID=124430 /ORGANISM="Phaeomonas parva, Strain CCMP2877" /LENGTH=387 /DNA_ID=CAMNT_0006783149 /DNA_START=7 /DNA_END=1170 /DNA_ORIENTATION=+